MKIIVHYPETPEKQAQFDARVAKFHAEYVAQYIEKLDCPTDQKLKLLDAVAQTILEGSEEKEKNNHLDQTLLELKNKFGNTIINKAGLKTFDRLKH